MDLSELLQWLSQGRKTGTLEIDNGQVCKLVYFDSGVIFSSASTDPKEYLGAYLASHGLVSDAEVDAAVALQESKKELLGKILVDMKSITEEQLQNILQAKAEEAIFDIFTWSRGDFRFLDGELPDRTMVRMSLDVQYIVLEGSRRVDDWNIIRQRIPSTQSVVVSVSNLEDESIDPYDRRILTWVDDDRTVDEIGSEARAGIFHVAKAIATQIDAGRIKLVRPRIVQLAVDPSAESRAQSATSINGTAGAPVTPSTRVAKEEDTVHEASGAQEPDHDSIKLGSGRTLRFAPSLDHAESAPTLDAPSPGPTPILSERESGATEAAQILDEGHQALSEGRLDDALKRFRRANGLGGGDRHIEREVMAGEQQLEAALQREGIRLTSVPRLECGMDELTKLDISPQEGFMLTRANGSYSLKEILKMSPMPQLDARVLLWRLKRSGHIGI